MTAKSLIIIAMWVIIDAEISLSLYWRNPNQTFWHDHYIRVIRLAMGIWLLWIGLML